MRAYNLHKKYNLTTEEYDKLLAEQQGLCAFCRKAYKKRLHVDHDHETGIVRGLLCFPCNKILVANHTLVTARQLVAYLEATSPRQ